jgi:periplasmic protein TonB
MSVSPEIPALVVVADEAAGINATRVPERRWPETLRWGGCLALALGIHAAGAAVLLGWGEAPDLVANAPVIMIELAMLPVAPDSKQTEVPPGPPQTQAEPASEPASEPAKPAEKTVEFAPAPQAEPLMPATAPPKPAEKQVEKKSRQKHASLASQPSAADMKAERAAAPTPGASSHNLDAVPNWKSQLVARLERYKQYPSQAQSRGEQGVAQLAFTVDRSGGVHNARITHSSGSNLLDEATLALPVRAAPLPPPPPEVAGAQIAITVPIRYSIR